MSNSDERPAIGSADRWLAACELSLSDGAFSSRVLWQIRVEAWARRAARLAGAAAAGFSGMVVAHALLTPGSALSVPAEDSLQVGIAQQPLTALLVLVLLGVAVAAVRALSD